MDKSKVKEQRNIFILSTGGIQKYLVIGSGKELKPLTQLTIRVIAVILLIRIEHSNRMN